MNIFLSVKQALLVYIIQTATSTAMLPETASLIEFITTVTNRMSDLIIKRK